MTDEPTIKWYRTPIDKQTLQKLTARSDGWGFAHVLGQLVLTGALGAVTSHAMVHWPWWVAAAMFYVYATFYSFLGLSGVGHELCHRTVFRTRFWNELFLRITGFLTWTNFHHFRDSHFGHHRWTVFHGVDLEVVLPLRVRWWNWVFLLTFDVPALWLTVRSAVRLGLGRFKGPWEARLFPESALKERRAVARWARVLLIGQAALAGGFVYFGLWPLVLLITFAVFFARGLNFLVSFPQHAGMKGDVPDYRICCRTMKLNPILRFFYCQMNYHVEHHMYAAVPFHKLAALRRTIEADLPPASESLAAAWRDILDAQARQQLDPGYAIVPTVPNRVG
ncbi:MAG: fatty acid desaturase [Planctomycetota bacterium]|nr:fatty acid desaturase [Planctomycetota bacterium]